MVPPLATRNRRDRWPGRTPARSAFAGFWDASFLASPVRSASPISAIRMRVRGIKGALDQGAAVAVAKLGVPGGFLNNPKVRIPLPPALDEVAKGMRMLGRGKDADELVAAMNSAAEKAVPEAKELLINAVKTMSVTDAKHILTGGDGSVTEFFRAKTAAPLAVKFLPIVKQETGAGGIGAEIRPVRRGGSETRPGQRGCRQHRGICNP